MIISVTCTQKYKRYYQVNASSLRDAKRKILDGKAELCDEEFVKHSEHTDYRIVK